MTNLGAYKPSILPHTFIGPAQFKYGKTVYYVKNGLTKRYFRIGQVEFFFLSRFDGTRTVDEIRAEFKCVESLVVTDDKIDRFIASLATRGLIADLSCQIDKSAEQVRRFDALQVTRRKFEIYVHLFDPDRFLDRLVNYFGWFFRMPTLMVLFAVNICLALGLGFQMDSLVSELKAVWSSMERRDVWSMVSALYACGFILTAIHEAGHCLVCKHYAGRVNDVGVMFRYLMIMAYSRLDDIVLLHSRWHRVHVLLGGVLANFLFQPILAIIWLVSDPISQTRVFVSILFLMSAIAIIFNLIPFVKMDGYFVLCQVLRCPDLREDSYRYLRSSVRRLFRDSDRGSEVSRRYGVIFSVYGVASIIVTICIVVLGVFRWFGVLVFYFGSWQLAVLVVGSLTVLWFYDEIVGRVFRKRSP